MIRVFFDELGNGHRDMFLKIDVLPTFLQVAGTYYLSNLCIKPPETKKDLANVYLNYFQGLIERIEGNEEIFIAFDLSDEYVGGLFLSSGKKELIKVEYGWTQEIGGWEFNPKVMEEDLIEHKKHFKIEREWQINKASVFEGLGWSHERVRNQF